MVLAAVQREKSRMNQSQIDVDTWCAKLLIVKSYRLYTIHEYNIYI